MTTKELRARKLHETPPLVIVNSDKGGQSKSFQTRVLTWQLSSSSIPLALFDGDERNPHLQRYYGQQFNTIRFDARSEAGWTHLFNCLDDLQGNEVVLVDLPAGVGAHLHKEAGRILANQEFGMPIVHVWMADPSEDSVRLFRDLMPIAPAEQTVFVKNKRDDASLDRFKIWTNSQTRAHFIAAGGIEITLPKLSLRLHDMIAAERLPFPDERPLNWARGDWFTFLSFKAQIESEQAALFSLLKEMCS